MVDNNVKRWYELTQVLLKKKLEKMNHKQGVEKEQVHKPLDQEIVVEVVKDF